MYSEDWPPSNKIEKAIIHERESKIEIRYLNVEEACTFRIEVARTLRVGSAAKGIGYHTHRKRGKQKFQCCESTEGQRWITA
jgi:transcriptional antiterminator Rof (Rho-off)